MAIGTAAAIALGAGALGAGGMAYMSSREQRKAQEEAMNLQRDLADPQAQLMSAFLPEYRELAPVLSGILKQKLQATELDPDIARSIGKYYGEAGTKLGTYFADKETLASGPANVLFSGLGEEEAATKLSTLLGERRQGISETLSFMGQQPSYNVPSIGIPSSGGSMDWSGIGSLLAKMKFGGTPKALDFGPSSASLAG